MKKIILLAIMLGLVGCGENGSSDVTSTTNNQSTELTSNSTQQASARSISTYSMTAPFDGWHLFNPKALGASALYEGIKDALTSSAVLTADASQVAKVLGKGVAGYALSVAVEQLLGAVDWVMDPANNRIKYTVKPLDPKDPTVQYYYSTGSKMSNGQSAFGLTALQACENLIAGTTRLAGKIANAEEIAKSNDRYCFYDQKSMLGNIYRNKNPAYDPSLKKEEYLLLETVAQKVIENADAGSLDAQVATMAAAAQILEDAANDEEIEQEIVDDLEANAKCPSGIANEHGDCWVCSRESWAPIRGRVVYAKDVTNGLGGCSAGMNSSQLLTRYSAYNELGEARDAENACWFPQDKKHLEEAIAAKTVATNCKTYLGILGQ